MAEGHGPALTRSRFLGILTQEGWWPPPHATPDQSRRAPSWPSMLLRMPAIQALGRSSLGARSPGTLQPRTRLPRHHSHCGSQAAGGPEPPALSGHPGIGSGPGERRRVPPSGPADLTTVSRMQVDQAPTVARASALLTPIDAEAGARPGASRRASAPAGSFVTRADSAPEWQNAQRLLAQIHSFKTHGATGGNKTTRGPRLDEYFVDRWLLAGQQKMASH